MRSHKARWSIAIMMGFGMAVLITFLRSQSAVAAIHRLSGARKINVPEASGLLAKQALNSFGSPQSNASACLVFLSHGYAVQYCRVP